MVSGAVRPVVASSAFVKVRHLLCDPSVRVTGHNRCEDTWLHSNHASPVRQTPLRARIILCVGFLTNVFFRCMLLCRVAQFCSRDGDIDLYVLRCCL
eukprot:23052-Eustigmatos_ZCMA.PRE.1